jgi:hypothetical protein
MGYMCYLIGLTQCTFHDWDISHRDILKGAYLTKNSTLGTSIKGAFYSLKSDVLTSEMNKGVTQCDIPQPLLPSLQYVVNNSEHI